MLARRRTALVAITCTVLILAAVNIGWWWYYQSITAYLEAQLSRQLTDVAATASLHISGDRLEKLLVENLDTYAVAISYLDSLAALDSLSEAAIIDPDFNYLASTRADLPSGGYLLAKLNFDSLTVALQGRPAASRLYNIDGIYLKSAYAPLFDSSGKVAALFVAEAGARYFDLLTALRRNLILLAGGSIGVVVILLLFYIIFNRRMIAAENQIFQSASQAALGRMVAVVSHEIKNPMMIIRASGERIEKKYHDPEAAFIVEEVSRLDGIVSGYLSFAKGTEPPTKESINLAALCDKIITDFRREFDEQGVTIDFRIAPDLPSITADPIGFRQVVVNLLLNALHAVTGEGHDKPERIVRLEISAADPSGRAIRLTVADNGPGIRPSERSKLFEPFYTTKTQGSGLGLYLCRRIIESHNGSIKVTDNKEGMTIFEVILPTGDSR